MSLLSGLEFAAGVVLLFFAPGYAVSRATFPEWRVRRGPDTALRLIELLTLSFVLSVALTVLAGYLLLTTSPGGFQAYWSSPVLEGILVAITVIGLGIAWYRGAFGHADTREGAPSPTIDSGEEGAWEMLEQLDRLAHDERRLLHSLRTAPTGSLERSRLEQELSRLRETQSQVQARREASYDR